MKLLYVLTAALVLAACQSGPVDTSPAVSDDELIQRGQEAADRGRYTLAIRYYEAVLDRHTGEDRSILSAGVTANIFAAEYEIAFVHYKQRKYDESRAEFQAILAHYASPNAATYPPEYQVLAKIGLEKIAAKTAD